jgi:hypothetical protein
MPVGGGVVNLGASELVEQYGSMMGFFRRAASAVNQADPTTAATIALSPSIRRVERLLARGTPANGVITGIRFSLNDETVRQEYAISTQTASGWQRIGVRTQPVESHRLRLGMSVVVRFDGDRGVLDWPAMAAAWGLGDGQLSQDSLRRPPDDGVVDTALDARVQRHLRKWTPTAATIESLSRRSMFGLPTQNWDITLRCADGSIAVSKGDQVPSYAQWAAAPGASVTAVVDPSDLSRASIDWPAFAIAGFDTAAFDDDPPEGSIAAEIEAGRIAGAVAAVSTAPTPLADDLGTPPTLDRTLQGWVDAVRGGHMKRNEFDQSLVDWQSAGMCTASQAAAARAAADG